MSNNTATQSPLAWSQSGDPIELPETAVMWRVRRLLGGAKGGAPEVVYGGDGLPLVVERNATADDFAEAVDRRPGKYRLDACDAARKPVAGVPPAYVMVGGSGAARDSSNDECSSVDRVVRTLADAMRTQCAQITALVDAAARLINAADGAGMTRRPPLPPPPPLVPTVIEVKDEKRRNGRDDDDDDENEDEDDEEPEKGIVDQAAELYEKLGADGIMAYAQAVPMVVGGVIEKVKSAVGGDGGKP